MTNYLRLPELTNERKIASEIKNNTSALTFKVKSSDSRSSAYKKVREYLSNVDVSCNDDCYDNLMKEF